MKGLEIVVFMLCIVFALPLTAVLLPGYNNGMGFDTGANDFANVNNAFNMSQLNSTSSSVSNQNNGILDQMTYAFNFAVMAIKGITTILFAGIGIAPQLLTAFGVNPVLSGVLLSIFALIVMVSLFQIIKGDDWSGRR